MIKAPDVWYSRYTTPVINRLVEDGTLDSEVGLDFFGWQAAINYFNKLDGGSRTGGRYFRWMYERPKPTNILDLDPEIQWEVAEILRLNGHAPKWGFLVNEDELWE